MVIGDADDGRSGDDCIVVGWWNGDRQVRPSLKPEGADHCCDVDGHEQGERQYQSIAYRPAVPHQRAADGKQQYRETDKSGEVNLFGPGLEPNHFPAAADQKGEPGQRHRDDHQHHTEAAGAVH